MIEPLGLGRNLAHESEGLREVSEYELPVQPSVDLGPM